MSVTVYQYLARTDNLVASTAWLLRETLLDLAILQSVEQRREESRAGVESRKETQTKTQQTNQNGYS